MKIFRIATLGSLSCTEDTQTLHFMINFNLGSKFPIGKEAGRYQRI